MRVNSITIDGIEFKIGDYCHVHRWSDKDPLDPWSVGHLSGIQLGKGGCFFKVEGNKTLDRWFPYCEKITADEGKELLERTLI